jgi:hypothetical protein
MQTMTKISRCSDFWKAISKANDRRVVFVVSSQEH